jgi:hypothetical protein
MILPNLMLSHLTHKYLVVNEDDLSTVANLTGNFHHTVQRLGLEDGSVTVSINPLVNILTVGSQVIYDLGLREIDDSNISFELNPAIQFGDEIKYVLETNYGLWVDRDTIVKTFGAISEQLTDNGSNTSNWTGNWNTTASEFYSPSTSFTDSPTGNYQNNSTRNFTLTQDVDLTVATSAMVSFYAKWEIEADYDYCQFQVSNDGGVTWIGQCGQYTVPGTSGNGGVQPDGKPVWEGVQTSWVQEEINLSDYLGQIINMRFQMRADGGVTDDGFYFDDFVLSYNLQDTSSNVSITELNSAGIRLFPNPSVSQFEVSGLEVGAEVIIIDANGREVFKMTSKNESENIQLKSVGSGTYIFSTSKENKSVRIPFVIQK